MTTEEPDNNQGNQGQERADVPDNYSKQDAVIAAFDPDGALSLESWKYAAADWAVALEEREATIRSLQAAMRAMEESSAYQIGSAIIRGEDAAVVGRDEYLDIVRESRSLQERVAALDQAKSEWRELAASMAQTLYAVGFYPDRHGRTWICEECQREAAEIEAIRHNPVCGLGEQLVRHRVLELQEKEVVRVRAASDAKPPIDTE